MIIGEKRNFLDTEGNVYYIKSPTTEDIRGADWTYSKMYTKSLTEGITTSAEMIDILRMRGVIGPEYDQRAKELSTNLYKAVEALEGVEDDTKRDLAIKVAEARDELFRWNQRFRGPMNHTCEQIADDSRLEYLTSCMVCNENNERIWKDYNSYLNEKDNNLAMRARVEVMLYLQGIDSDFMEKTPEARAIREIEDKATEDFEEALRLQDILEQEDEAAAKVAETILEDDDMAKKAKKKEAPKVVKDEPKQKKNKKK